MGSVTQLPAEFDLVGVAGSPFAITLTVTLKNGTGATIPWATFTSPTVVLSTPGAPAPAVTAHTANKLVISWTASQTSATPECRFALQATIQGSGPETLIAGALTFKAKFTTGTEAGTSGTVAVTVGSPSATIDLAITLAGGGGGGVASVNGHTGTVTLHASTVTAIPTSQKGAHTGVATLDSGGHLPASESEALTGDVTSPAGSSTTTVNKVKGVAVSGTAATGKVLKATGASTAAWSTPPSGPPSGTASGDLSGTYPSPTVAKVNGKSPGAATGPALLDSGGHVKATETAAITGDVTKAAGSSSATVKKIQGHTVTPTVTATKPGNSLFWSKSLSKFKAGGQVVAADLTPTTGAATLLQTYITTWNTRGGGKIIVPAFPVPIKLTKAIKQGRAWIAGSGTYQLKTPATPPPSSGLHSTMFQPAATGTTLTAFPANAMFIWTTFNAKLTELTIACENHALTHKVATGIYIGDPAYATSGNRSKGWRVWNVQILAAVCAVYGQTYRTISGAKRGGCQDGTFWDLMVANGRNPGIFKVSLTAASTTKTIVVKTTTGIINTIVPGMVFMYAAHTNSAIKQAALVVAVNTTTRTVTLDTPASPHTGDSVYFIGAVAAALNTFDCMFFGMRNLGSCFVGLAANTTCNEGHHSDPGAVATNAKKLGAANVVNAATNVRHENCTYDTGATLCSALVRNVRGTLLLSGKANFQNGTKTNFPAVVTDGGWTTCAVIIDAAYKQAQGQGRLTALITFKNSSTAGASQVSSGNIAPTTMVTTPNTTLAATSNGGTIATIATWSAPSAGVLAVASNSGFPASGTLVVVTSTGNAVVHYTGKTGTTKFTGCTLTSGSGTVSTGALVWTQTSTTPRLYAGGTPGLSREILYGTHLQSTIPAVTAALPKTTTSGPYAAKTFSSTGAKMAGAAARFTPVSSGKVIVTITGYVGTVTSAKKVTLCGRYGTGTSPASGAAATGTKFAQTTIVVEGPAAATTTKGNGNFTLTATITGLTVGTSYWVDFSVKATTSTDKALVSGVITTVTETN